MPAIILLFLVFCSSFVFAQVDTAQAAKSIHLLNEVDTLIYKGAYKLSIPQLLPIIEQTRANKDWQTLAKAQYKLIQSYYGVQNYPLAKEKGEAFIQEAYQNLDDRDTLIAKMEMMVGGAYLRLGQLEQAVAIELKAKEKYEYWLTLPKHKKRAQQRLAKVLTSMGGALFHKGAYEEAEEYVLKSIGYGTQGYGEGDVFLADVYNLLGAIYTRRALWKQAVIYFNKSLEIKEANYPKKSMPMARAYNNMGVLYKELQQHEKSLEYMLMSLKIKQELLGANSEELAKMYLNVGSAYFGVEDYKEASLFTQKSLEKMKATYGPNHINVFRIYSSLGGVLVKQNKYDEALSWLNKSLEGEQEILGNNHDLVAGSYYSIAQLQLEKKNWQEVINNTMSAIDIYTHNFGTKHQKIADCYMLSGDAKYYQEDFDGAMIEYHKALLSLLPDEETIDPLVIPTEAFNAQNYLSASKVAEVLERKAIVLKSKYETNADLGMLEQAYQQLQAAIGLFGISKDERSREDDKAAFLQQIHKTYARSIEVSLLLYKETKNEQYLENAFQMAEQNKSILLRDALNMKTAQQMGGVPDSLIAQENGLSKNIVQLEKKLRDAHRKKNTAAIGHFEKALFLQKEERERLQKKLEQEYPKYYELKYTENIVSVKELQEQLTPKTMLIEYFVADSNVTIFSITSTSIDAQQVLFNDLKKAIRHYRKSLTQTDFKAEQVNDLAEKGWNFYQLLLDDLLTENKDVEELIIIADGLLGYLPFEVFLTEEPVVGNYSYDLPYLLKKYMLSYHYSATLWLENNKQKQNSINNEILAFAAAYDPSEMLDHRNAEIQFTRSMLDSIPGVRDEIMGLEKLLAGKFLYDSEANEANFKKHAPNYNVLHLAMHGVLDRYYPMASSLAFTENKDTLEDNFLYAYELSNLFLNAHLVVLSACETGYGKFKQGEGVMSLARSFMYAGVPSLVMSLWSVNDRATAVLMQYYYTELANGSPKNKALQQAKLKYLKQAKGVAKHPVFWAPFVQLGNTQPIELTLKKDGLNYWYWLGGSLLLFSGIVFFLRQKRSV
ncbi:MAG: CHAT domain-containing protein [Aureispira sp.]|nr:CHAT domain-containing protein [Aureispira sp.]